MKNLLILTLLLIVTGCITSYQLKSPGDARPWNSYTVSLQEETNEMKSDKVVGWTKYGVLLENIEFWKPVGDGEKLPLTYSPGMEEKAPLFRKDMTPEEILELIQGGFALTFLTPSEFTDLRPFDFGGKQGYLANIQLSSNTGGNFKRQVLFTSETGKLEVISLVAQSLHYFDERKAVFETIAATIQY